MRLLANENVPGEAVIDLRRRGHDVAWILEDAPGTTHPEVLTRAQTADWAGHFAVVEDDQIRLTPLPERR